MLDHNDTLGARQHRRVMWLGYYVVSQVLQATMRQSCRTRGMTRSIDPASTPRHRCLPGVPTCFSLITALCLWWRPNASLADHRNRIPYYTWTARQGHESAFLHSLYSLHRLTTATIYWQLVCPMSHDKSMRCSSLPETEAYATFQKFHASNRSLPLDDSRTQVKIYCLCMQLGSILPSQDRSSLRRMAYAWAF
jgi:hypothetical protein